MFKKASASPKLGTVARRTCLLTALVCGLAAVAPLSALATSTTLPPPRTAPPAVLSHAPRLPHPAHHGRSFKDVRWNDGATFAAGAACDVAYRTLTVHTVTNLSSGWVMAGVYDVNTKRRIYLSDWFRGNTWQELMRQSAFAPVLHVAVYVSYARLINGQWSYGGEWLVDYSQDDVYSHSCYF